MTPHEEGRTAYANGHHLTNNPHSPGPIHDQWQSGWVLAERCAAWREPSINDERDRRARMWETV